VMKYAKHRLLRRPVIVDPTTSWTLQHLRSAMPSNHGYRVLKA
jgi:hypothetical protein